VNPSRAVALRAEVLADKISHHRYRLRAVKKIDSE
jgi:hypothetical protein